ncbi:MAG: hypothetical protein JJ872_11705 [Marivivens sp.]|nr:hypothetical protein [Marivivens sp.]
MLALATAATLYLRRRNQSQELTNEDLYGLIDARLAEVKHTLSNTQQEAITAVRDDIRVLQSDMDWLAGERMIDEAITMARSGRDAHDISTELGMSVDAAQAIAEFRKH